MLHLTPLQVLIPFLSLAITDKMYNSSVNFKSQFLILLPFFYKNTCLYTEGKFLFAENTSYINTNITWNYVRAHAEWLLECGTGSL